MNQEEYKADTVAKKIVERNDSIREEGFWELSRWQDSSYSKAQFFKQLHIFLKEKNEKILTIILDIIKNVYLSKEDF